MEVVEFSRWSKLGWVTLYKFDNCTESGICSMGQKQKVKLMPKEIELCHTEQYYIMMARIHKTFLVQVSID